MYLPGAGEFGWPTSVALPAIPQTDDEKTSLIDILQEWKTQKYQDMIGKANNTLAKRCRKGWQHQNVYKSYSLLRGRTQWLSLAFPLASLLPSLKSCFNG